VREQRPLHLYQLIIVTKVCDVVKGVKINFLRESGLFFDWLSEGPEIVE